jgi:adenine-specific DNA-methyltransferase
VRYLGNKQKLRSEIYDLILDRGLLNESLTFCDAFSGTASVSEYFKDKFKIIANDNQYYSYVMSQAKLNTPDMQFVKLGFDPFVYFNNRTCEYEGFIYNNYSDIGSPRMYFSAQNGLKIDYIRKKIDDWNKQEKLSEFEYYYLIACLLESASKVANIAGVYGSYLKTWDPRALKPMQFIKVEQSENNGLYEAEVHNKTVESLINDISGDILYLDPPYTKNQYSVQYHLLETLAKNDNPKINGKGGLRNTTLNASAFSKQGEVEVEFEKIVAKSKFRYIILSYNSDGIMSQKFIEKVLKRYGKPETYVFKKIGYKQYNNHQTVAKKEHLEYLFFIEKLDYEHVSFASPLNYQGGKYDLVNFIKDNLPVGHIERFVDLFGGGYNVGINVNSEQIVYNEYNHKVVELIETFKNTETSDFLKYILRMQKRYKLLPTAKDAYINLRDKYNSIDLQKRDPKMLYMLILYGFNQQLRFNSSHDWNNPVGPAGLNDCMLEKITSFSRRIQEQNIVFLSRDFEDVLDYIDDRTFVYCDPPYLITLGSYNDGKRGFNGWTESDEMRLYSFLDGLSERRIKFMLSNVIEHKGKTNAMLKDWIKANDYNIITHSGTARKSRKEVLVTNYKKGDKNDKSYYSKK